MPAWEQACVVREWFAMQAAENGIRKILKHGRPLRKLKDVESLELGKETTAKVAELVETGQLARNKASQADPTAQLILKVLFCYRSFFWLFQVSGPLSSPAAPFHTNMYSQRAIC